MKVNPQRILILFFVLWIVFIVWGMVRTSFKLSEQKKAAGSFSPEIAAMTKAQEEQQQLLPVEKVAAPKPSEVFQKLLGKKGKDAQTTIEPEIKPEVEIPAVLVRTFKVQTTDFSDILPVMGAVKGNTEIELRFEVNGVIEAINFREGEKIKQADLVASINPHEAQLKLEYAKNKFASAQASYESSLKKLEIHQRLYQSGAIIKVKLDELELECKSLRFQTETAKAEQGLAENELKKTKLFAPIGGVMGPREAEEGEFVTPQDKVGSLLEIDEVLVEVGIVERDINKIKLGQQAKVFVDAYPDKIFDGILDNIFPTVEGRSRTLTAKIRVHNPEGLLLPGMFSRAEIKIIELKNALIIPSICLVPTAKERTMVPVIPQESLQAQEDGAQVGRVQLRQVEIGYMTSDYAQVLEGVNAGDLVVTEAQGELQDNAQVRITAIEESP